MMSPETLGWKREIRDPHRRSRVLLAEEAMLGTDLLIADPL